MPVSLGWKGETSGVGAAHQCPPNKRWLWGGTRALGVIVSSPAIAHIPSSFVRTGVTQLKAGSFLRVPTLHLL